MRANRRGLVVAGVVLVLGAGAFYFHDAFADRAGLAEEPVEARESSRAGRGPAWAEPKAKPKAKIVSDADREDLLSRAQVWQQPAMPIEQVDFADRNTPRWMRCRFRLTELGGTTPKFDCDLETGELVRIKYGRTGELPAELASTRLLRAFGFGADYVTLIEKLRCYGCPEEPFSVMKAVEITKAERLYRSLMLSYDKYEEFEWVAFERKLEGRAIETERLAGWAMFELSKVQPAKGGAPRAHLDALRLFAVFLAHWDNKSDNQRLICRGHDDWQKGQRCQQPFLLLQDLGSTFGPSKVDLEAWKKTRIWEDRATCLASMRDLPYNGATFEPVRISEEGRRFLAGMLTRISERQLTDLFTSARFDAPLGLLGRSSPVLDWVRAFTDRVHQISDGPACPPT